MDVGYFADNLIELFVILSEREVILLGHVCSRCNVQCQLSAMQHDDGQSRLPVEGTKRLRK